MRIKLRAHGPSNGARNLARSLGIKRLKREGSRFRPRPDDVIINWGCGTPFVPAGRIINLPAVVNRAASKIRSLAKMKEAGVTVPDFTNDAEIASQWLQEGYKVVGRQLDRGSSGRGIVFMTKPEEFQRCPLYTKYVPKIDEYRVHVFDGKVIDVQQKRRKNGADWNNQIRTHSQGWIFARADVQPPKTLLDMAVKAVEALELDFGAVDIGWTRNKRQATVYEVNTAPGLEGTTLESYTKAFKERIQAL